jgi:hypothetical protein
LSSLLLDVSYLKLIGLALSGEMIDEFCENGTIKEYRFVDLQKTLKDLDKSMAEIPAKYMCTSNYCPCPADTDFNLWAANET